MTDKQEDNRDNRGKFLPGKSGNPNGRPRGKTVTERVREELEKKYKDKDYTNFDAYIQSILKKAIEEGDSNMIKLIWNYVDGMPTQPLNVAGEVLVKIAKEVSDKYEINPLAKQSS